jgi:uncharacterized membrane protein (UPF0127 family)
LVKIIQLNTDRGILCVAEVADTHWKRLRGLLGRRRLAQGEGMWFKPCKSVHTFFMAFPIDVVYLTKEDVVAKVEPRLRPFSLSWGGPGAHTAVELPAGTIDRLRLRPGDPVMVRLAAIEREQLSA